MRYYATLGYKPAVLLDLRDFLVDRPAVTVFHGDRNPRQARAVERAGILLREMDVTFEFVEIESPWNLEECLGVLFATWKKHGRPHNLVMNASGGTEVMNAAAAVFSMFARCQGRFWDRRRGRPKAISFGALLDALALDGSRKNLFDALVESGGILPLASLPEKLALTGGAITKLLQDLEAAGLVKVAPREQGRGKDVFLAAKLWPFLIMQNPAFRRIERVWFTADEQLLRELRD